MMKLDNLDKYFNKRKPNEIHVINHISLEFPERGLVCLLGPSGCGKTTLLNVIGGLDYADSGVIYYQGNEVNRRKMDQLRISEIGFVFQNYVLFPERTVYDNLKLVLEVFDLTDAQKEERILYALRAVGMEKYKKRAARQLSGGQQQRVAIARALVKSPGVIIADEPTGNLDEKNTIQIMNIIKKLSAECLVILVTHERRLADFFADRIIELLDGTIQNDYENNATCTLTAKDDTNIYLQDMQMDQYGIEEENIRFFYEEKKPNLKLNVIFNNDTFYIQALPEDSNIMIKMVDKDSETLLIDGKKPEISKDYFEDFDYHMDKIEHQGKVRSTFRLKEIIRLGFQYFRSLRTKQKIFLFTFFLAAMLIVFSMATLFRSLRVEEADFQTFDRNYYHVAKLGGFSESDYTTITNNGQYKTAPTFNGYVEGLRFNAFEINNTYIEFPKASFASVDKIKNTKLLFGELPKSADEVVIDKRLIDYLCVDENPFVPSQFLSVGGSNDYQILLGKTLVTNDMLCNISGVVDTNEPNIYVDDALLNLAFVSQRDDYFDLIDKAYQSPEYMSQTSFMYAYFDLYNDMDAIYINNLVVAKSEVQLKDNEVLVGSRDLFETICGANSFGYLKIAKANDYVLKVVGYIDSYEKTIYTNTLTMQNLAKENILRVGSILVDTEGNTSFIRDLESKGYLTDNLYKLEKTRYREKNLTKNMALLTFTGVVLAISLVFLYFIVRSSLIARIYEIGVYRALGVKKMDLYKLFISELLFITLFTSVFGYLFGSYLMIEMQNSMFSFVSFYPWYAALGAFVIIWVFNLGVGIIPINRLLARSPAQIISKYDI